MLIEPKEKAREGHHNTGRHKHRTTQPSCTGGAKDSVRAGGQGKIIADEWPQGPVSHKNKLQKQITYMYNYLLYCRLSLPPWPSATAGFARSRPDIMLKMFSLCRNSLVPGGHSQAGAAALMSWLHLLGRFSRQGSGKMRLSQRNCDARASAGGRQHGNNGQAGERSGRKQMV